MMFLLSDWRDIGRFVPFTTEDLTNISVTIHQLFETVVIGFEVFILKSWHLGWTFHLEAALKKRLKIHSPSWVLTHARKKALLSR